MVSIIPKSSNTVPFSAIHIGDFFGFSKNIYLKLEDTAIIVAYGEEKTKYTPELGVEVSVFTEATPVYVVETIFNVIQ